MKKILSWHKLLICAVMLSANAQAQIVDSFLSFNAGLAVDAGGTAYVSTGSRIYKRPPGGMLTAIAGVPVSGVSDGDGGPATAAHLYSNSGLARDGAGNLYFIDHNSTIRKISTLGIITSIAGTGVSGYSGDGGPATAAQITVGYSIASDAAGNVYAAADNGVVRKISTSGIITTVAGNGTVGYSGDGGPAAAAQLGSYIFGLAVDNSGNIFISDLENNRVRKVSASGIITTIAGNGTAGSSGDGGPATAAQLEPSGLVVDGGGQIFVGNYSQHRVRKITPSGTISTFAGTGVNGCSGDGGPATAAQLWLASVTAIDASGNLYVNLECNKVKKISPGTNSIDEVSLGERFSIIPTVNSGEFVVKCTEVGGDELTLEVSNLLGQSVYSNAIKTNSGAIEHHVRLDNSLPAGMYVATLRSSSGARSEKFVIAR